MPKYFLPNPAPLKYPHASVRNFNYMHPIQIKGSNVDLRDYQVRIVLNRNNFPLEKCQSDGRDIRFRDSTGQILPHWIEYWNSNEAAVWCKIPFIPAHRTKDIWIIFGNPVATSLSNGYATFDFFDEFDTFKTGNPVMNEDVYEKDPGVWYDSASDTYYIYFTYRPDPSSSSDTYISMRTTTDHFQTYTSRVDLWNHYAAPSNIIKRDSTYYMFVTSYPDSADPKGYCRIYYSTSTDLINWATPTLAFERSTGWNGGTKRSIDPNLYKEGDTWYLFYVGKDDNKNAPGYATTSDADFPTGWVDQTTSEPLLTPTESWEGWIIEAITVWKVGDLYYMLYSGGNSPQQEGLATASDISGPWTRYGTDGRVNHPFESWSQYCLGQYDILRQGAESWRSGEHWNDGKYHVIFQGKDSPTVQSWSLGLASSEDLINYTNLAGKWKNTYTSGVETTNGYLKFVDPEPVNNILKGVYSNAVFDPSSHAIVCRVWGKPKGLDSHDDFFSFGWYKDDENNYKVDFGPSNLRDWDLGVGGLVSDAWYGVTGHNDEFDQQTYYTLQLRKIGTTVYLDADYVNKLSKSDDGFTFTDTKVGMSIWEEGEWHVDWIFVRKYVNPEPIVIL